MARKINNEEKLDDSHMEHVCHMMEKGDPKPWNKKESCRYLNIAYNVARLDKLITQYQEKKVRDAERRAEKKGKPATKDEVSFIVKEYLEGTTIDSISKSLFRGTTFVNSILAEYNVPKRQVSTNYFKPELIPDDAVRTEFKVGEKVWSARYNSIATVQAELIQKGQKVYRCWLDHEAWQQLCYQPWWELASLQKLRDEGFLN